MYGWYVLEIAVQGSLAYGAKIVLGRCVMAEVEYGIRCTGDEVIDEVHAGGLKRLTGGGEPTDETGDVDKHGNGDDDKLGTVLVTAAAWEMYAEDRVAGCGGNRGVIYGVIPDGNIDETDEYVIGTYPNCPGKCGVG